MQWNVCNEEEAYHITQDKQRKSEERGKSAVLRTNQSDVVASCSVVISVKPLISMEVYKTGSVIDHIAYPVCTLGTYRLIARPVVHPTEPISIVPSSRLNASMPGGGAPPPVGITARPRDTGIGCAMGTFAGIGGPWWVGA